MTLMFCSGELVFSNTLKLEGCQGHKLRFNKSVNVILKRAVKAVTLSLLYPSWKVGRIRKTLNRVNAHVANVLRLACLKYTQQFMSGAHGRKLRKLSKLQK